MNDDATSPICDDHPRAPITIHAAAARIDDHHDYYIPLYTTAAYNGVVGYSLLVQASRLSAIFTMLAAAVRIYSTLTSVAVLTHFDNKRAAADQYALVTMLRRQSYNVSTVSSKLQRMYVGAVVKATTHDSVCSAT